MKKNPSIKNTLTFFIVNICLFSLTFFVLLSELKTPILKSNDSIFFNNCRILLPQKFNFFTNDPFNKIINIYEKNNISGEFEKTKYFPLNSKKNLYGIDKTPRFLLLDLKNIISSKKISKVINNEEGINIQENINKHKNTPGNYFIKSNEKYYILEKKEYFISVQDVIPYPWRESLTQSKMKGYFFKIIIQ